MALLEMYGQSTMLLGMLINSELTNSELINFELTQLLWQILQTVLSPSLLSWKGWELFLWPLKPFATLKRIFPLYLHIQFGDILLLINISRCPSTLHWKIQFQIQSWKRACRSRPKDRNCTTEIPHLWNNWSTVTVHPVLKTCVKMKKMVQIPVTISGYTSSGLLALAPFACNKSLPLSTLHYCLIANPYFLVNPTQFPISRIVKVFSLKYPAFVLAGLSLRRKAVASPRRFSIPQGT